MTRFGVGTHLVIRTPAERDRRGRSAGAIDSSRIHLVFAPPWDLFSAVRRTPEHPASSSLAHRDPAGGHKELSPLNEVGPRTLFEVFPRGVFWPSRPTSASCLGPSKAPRCGARLAAFTVALDRGAIDAETAGGLGPGYSRLNRLYDLLSWVKRTCTHASTMPGAPSSQSAFRR
jgi:hypothetical protein